MGVCIYKIDSFIQIVEGDKYSSCYIDYIKRQLMNYPSEVLAKEKGVKFVSRAIDDNALFLTLFYLGHKRNGEFVKVEDIQDYLKEHGYGRSENTIRNRMTQLKKLFSDYLSIECGYPSSELVFTNIVDGDCQFVTSNGQYVTEKGEECNKPDIEDPKIQNRKTNKKISLNADGEELVNKFEILSDEQILERLNIITKDKNLVSRVICLEAVKKERTDYLIEEIIDNMDNNAEKYNLAEELADNGYISSRHFKSVVYAIDNSLYLYRIIRLLLSFKELSYVEDVMSRIRNNNYIADSLEAIYEVDKALFKKLYNDGKCFRPSPKERIELLAKN